MLLWFCPEVKPQQVLPVGYKGTYHELNLVQGLFYHCVWLAHSGGTTMCMLGNSRIIIRRYHNGRLPTSNT